MPKRKRSQSKTRPPPRRVSFKKYAKKKKGRTPLSRKVNQMYRMIETKESTPKTTPDIAFAHNNVVILQRVGGGDLNPFITTQGAADPLAGEGQRIGDQITVKGLLIKGFFENSISRPKVYYRLMLVRCAKGDIPNRANLYKGDTGNKMIDQINTERFTIVRQKIFNIGASNATTSAVSLTGEPVQNIAGDVRAGIGTRIVSMWIPGKAFGRNGNVQYESNSTGQVKFYD